MSEWTYNGKKWKKHTSVDTKKKCTVLLRDGFMMCFDENVFFLSSSSSSSSGNWMWNGWLSSWQSNSMPYCLQLRRNILCDAFPFINASYANYIPRWKWSGGQKYIIYKYTRTTYIRHIHVRILTHNNKMEWMNLQPNQRVCFFSVARESNLN